MRTVSHKVTVAEGSNAVSLSLTPHLRAWVRIPVVTTFFSILLLTYVFPDAEVHEGHLGRGDRVC